MAASEHTAEKIKPQLTAIIRIKTDVSENKIIQTLWAHMFYLYYYKKQLLLLIILCSSTSSMMGNGVTDSTLFLHVRYKANIQK